MGSGSFCDRCMRARRDLVRIALPGALEYDLCVPCCGAMARWIGETARRVGSHAVRGPQKKSGDWSRIFDEVLARDGEVKPATMAAMAGVSTDTAHWQLNYMVRQRSIRRIAPGRYGALREAAE